MTAITWTGKMTTLLILLLLCGTTHAQFSRRLGRAVDNAAKRTIERKAEQKTEEAVGKAIDKATDPDTYKGDGKEEDSDNKKTSFKKQSSGNDEEDEAGEATAADTPKGVKAAEMAYAKSDFVAGDEIIFEDSFEGEQLGEFPSQWDLEKGTLEIASVNGQKAIDMFKWGTTIMPLMKNPKNYLGDVFTLEFDVLSPAPEKDYNSQWFTIQFIKPDASHSEVMKLEKATNFEKDGRISWGWVKTEGSGNGGEEVALKYNKWEHFAISFNKRAYKIYVNGVRMGNVPNVATPPGWFRISVGNGEHHTYFKNFRIAKGAVPLYDRMMSDGKIVTYGITFDVGKSTIKPESMGEINRIAKLMVDNPDLKFSVEGHTDSVGAVDSNQKLSDARSQAVVDKLVEMGVSKDRLTSAGKGQTAPIADNATDEGRAKNRRVEFVKIN